MIQTNSVAFLVIFLVFVVLFIYTCYSLSLLSRIKNYFSYRQLLCKFRSTMPPIIQQAYSSNGIQLSKKFRKENQLKETQYTYGEIDLLALLALLYDLKPTAQDQFYDLGCGLGLTVFLAGLCFKIKKSVGIEILAPLHQTSTQILQHHQSNQAHKTNPIQFIHADFLNVSLNEASIVFINATAMMGELWIKIEEKLSTLTPGTRVIVISHRLPTPSFRLIDQMMQPMNWGLASTFVYVKQ